MSPVRPAIVVFTRHAERRVSERGLPIGDVAEVVARGGRDLSSDGVGELLHVGRRYCLYPRSVSARSRALRGEDWGLRDYDESTGELVGLEVWSASKVLPADLIDALPRLNGRGTAIEREAA